MTSIQKNIKNLFLLLFISFHISSYSQDIVKFQSGDSIICKITKITEDTIFMKKIVKNTEIKTYIAIDKVKDYRFHIIELIKKDNDTSVYWSLLMEDGNELIGRVISFNKRRVSFEDNNLGRVDIDAISINSIKKEDSDGFYLIKLTDGNQLHGKIIKRTKNDIEFETETLGKVTVPTSKIKKMQIVDEGKMEGGEYWFPNPNNTRYFFAPSAFNLKEGEAYYQNVYFLMNSANYGISDHFSIGGGIIIPFAVYVTPKVNFKIAEKFYAGVGVLAGILPDLNTVGITYGITTYGTDENNITLGVGYGFYNDRFADRPIITLNAMARISRKVALVTENWSIPFNRTEYDYNYNTGIETRTPIREYDTFISYGMRLMFGEKVTIDIALINGKYIFEFMPVGIPYVDFVLKFGK